RRSGGNVRSVLPEPCHRSLPTVFDANDIAAQLAASELQTTVVFDWNGTPLVLRLLGRERTSEIQADGVGRREFSRVPVFIAAEITTGGERYEGGTMENLSLKGGFYRSNRVPADGVKVDVRLYLDGTDIVIATQGIVVRSGPSGCALQFTEIVGVESLEHLRNLILFNTHDPHQVEREFQEHLGLLRAD